MIKKIEESTDLQLHDGITMYTFSAPGCIPCKYMNPVMDKIAGKSDRIHLYRIDSTQHTDLAAAYNVKSVPTVFIYYNKQLKHVLHSLVGIKHELELM